MGHRPSVADDAAELPRVVEARAEGAPGALARWMDANADEIDRSLLEAGAVLLRGFGVATPDEFEDVALRVAPVLAPYRGAGVRRAVRGRVYTASEAPRWLPIPAHCELAYSAVHPDRVLFWCETPPTRGGETPIVDMAAACRALDPAVRERFGRSGLRFVENAPPEPSRHGARPWPEMFETSDRAVVEQLCQERRIDARWKPDGTLQMVSIRPAEIDHPRTGERIWFNSAHMFHGSWSAELRRAGRPLLGGVLGLREWWIRRLEPDDRSRHCSFGDGTGIPDEDIRHVRETLWSNEVALPWRRGDVLILDNLRIAHARRPFSGPRRILVAMGDSAARGHERPAGSA